MSYAEEMAELPSILLAEFILRLIPYVEFTALHMTLANASLDLIEAASTEEVLKLTMLVERQRRGI